MRPSLLVERAGIIESEPYARGIDALTGDGAELLRRVSEAFYETAESCMPCRFLPQELLFDAEKNAGVYGDIRQYDTSLATEDGRHLFMHDPTLPSLHALRAEQGTSIGILGSYCVFRESTGDITPLETVKYHHKTPTFHCAAEDSEMESRRELMETFVRRFLSRFPIPHIVGPNRRDVSHYADWSLSGYTEGGLEITAGYQLSSVFSKALKSDHAYFEIAISTRFVVGLFQETAKRLKGRVILPWAVAPVQVNAVVGPSAAPERVSSLRRDVAARCRWIMSPSDGMQMVDVGRSAAQNAAPATLFVGREPPYFLVHADLRTVAFEQRGKVGQICDEALWKAAGQAS